MNISLLKKIDAAIGCISASIFPTSVNNEIPATFTSLLLIRPGGIGDAVLLATVINSLKNYHPALQITLLAEQRNAGVFQLIPCVDRLFCYDRPRDLLQVLCAKYDVVIDSEQWHRLSAIVARLIAAPVKIGFETNERRRMFTHRIPYSHNDYEAISFAHLLVPLGIEHKGAVMADPFLSVPHSASCIADALLKPYHDQPFVTIFPGASIPERRWGTERFRRVAELLTTFGIRIVVVGGKEDLQQGDEIVVGESGLNLAGLTTLAETAAVIQRSSLLLSGDSGVLHVAVGLGVPTVSLFGPGRSKKWAPQGSKHVVINKELTCSPCTNFGHTPTCPIDVRCMQEITVDEVFNAVTMLLTNLGAMPSMCCKKDWIEKI